MSAPAGSPVGAPPRNASLAEFPLISEWIAFEPDGTVRVRSGRVDLGQGIATALVAIAASALGVAPAAIHLVAGDTRECPDEGVTAGSLSVAVGGMAVRAAAAAARARLLARAAELLQASPGQLSVAAGEVLRDGVATGLTLARLAAEVDLATPIADAAAPPPPRPTPPPSAPT